MLNKKGFGIKEIMAVFAVLFAIFVIMMYVISKPNMRYYYRRFKRLAFDFASEAEKLRAEEPRFTDLVYLYDAYQFNYFSRAESPFNSDIACDEYESKLQINGEARRITFRCGEYLIYNQSPSAEEVTIYKVSEWSDVPIAGDNVQEATFYNYSLEEEEQLPTYYIEKQFIEEYKNRERVNINNPNDIDEKYELLKKTYYRTFDEVITIK